MWSGGLSARRVLFGGRRARRSTGMRGWVLIASITGGALVVARMDAMETAKEQVQQILQMLPEDASLEDIQYHIYVRQKIQQGLEDAETGRVLSHAEVQQRL